MAGAGEDRFRPPEREPTGAPFRSSKEYPDLPRTALGLTILLASFAFSPAANGQAMYSTGFEAPDFTVGPVAGQDGWGHLSNSPTGGTIVPTPLGSPAALGAQSLELFTRESDFFGVANHLYSATIDPPGGEPGSTIESVPVVDPQPVFLASFWYRTPSTPVISTSSSPGRFAELNPSSKGPADDDAANRYANVRLFNNTNDPSGLVRVEVGWYTAYPAFTTAIVANGLAWGEWYRFEYAIRFVDGPPGAAGSPGPPANDLFTVRIFDRDGAEIGAVGGALCASTWESGWKTGLFGDTPTARAVNGFDFWSTTGPDATVVGHLDDFTITTADAAPVALQLVSGDGQSGPVSTPLPEPLVVRVADDAGQAQCYPVAFAIETTPPGAMGQALGSTPVVPAADGQAATTFTLGDLEGPYTVSASVAGAAGSPVIFTATAGDDGGGAPPPPTAVPTLAEWALAALALVLAALGLGVLRHQGS